MVPMICYERFHDIGLCGYIDIPIGSCCTLIEDILIYNNQPICFKSSSNFQNHFTYDGDGDGIIRGELIHKIFEVLNNSTDKYHQDRWNKIQLDNTCKKFQRLDSLDHWLWNDLFFSASISDLQHIFRLITYGDDKGV